MGEGQRGQGRRTHAHSATHYYEAWWKQSGQARCMTRGAATPRQNFPPPNPRQRVHPTHPHTKQAYRSESTRGQQQARLPTPSFPGSRLGFIVQEVRGGRTSAGRHMAAVRRPLSGSTTDRAYSSPLEPPWAMWSMYTTLCDTAQGGGEGGEVSEGKWASGTSHLANEPRGTYAPAPSGRTRTPAARAPRQP